MSLSVPYGTAHSVHLLTQVKCSLKVGLIILGYLLRKRLITKASLLIIKLVADYFHVIIEVTGSFEIITIILDGVFLK